MQKLDYQNIRQHGRRIYAQRWLILVVAPNRLQGPRYGWTLPRYVGGAVLRNKYKRWLRELLREWQKSPSRGSGLRRPDPRSSQQAPVVRAAAGRPVPLQGWDINFVFKKMDKGFYKNKTFSQFKYEIKKALQNVDKKIKK